MLGTIALQRLEWANLLLFLLSTAINMPQHHSVVIHMVDGNCIEDGQIVG